MDKCKENLGIVVREARDRSGYTQSQLAELLGLDDKTILNIENFRGNPKFENLYSLVNLLKIPGDKIFYPGLSDPDPYKQQLLIEVSSLSENEAKELLRFIRYMQLGTGYS